MPNMSSVSRRLLRLSVLATASALALLSSQPTIADSSITIGVNSWQGSANTDWFHSANWWGGRVFNLPDPIFPVYIGPVQLIVNGFPTDTYDLPTSEAVLRGAFSTSSLDMRAWDGISQIRLESGALLTTGSATIGQLHTVYQPSGPIQKATLVLAGGQITGSLSFYAQSRLVVSGLYGVPSGHWSGTLGELQINSGATLSLPAGNLTIDQINNAGALTVASGRNITLAGTVQNAGSFTLGGSGNVGTAAVYLAGNTTLAGSGSTVLTDANYSYVGGTGVLTVGQGHTLRGSGYVAVGIANQGSVVADGVLTVNGGSGNTFDNGSGLVQVADGGMLALSGGTLSGGTVQGLGAGSRLGGNGTFQSVALSGQLLLTGGTTLDSVSSTGQVFLGGGNNVSTRGTLTNTGTLTLGGGGNVGMAALYLAGNTTLAGSGSTVLTDANYSYVGGTGVLTVGQGHTLRGSGYVAVGIANQGSVVADGVLTVNGGSGNTFDNGSGLVQVANGGLLSLAGGTLTGGTVQGLGAGSRMGGSGTFQNVALQGTWLVAPGSPLNVSGTLTNGGALTLGGGGNTGMAAVYLAGNTTLAGSGSTVLTDANYSYVGGTGVLTVGQGHTLRGSGYVAVGIANQGTVVADGVFTVNGGTGNTFDNSSGLVQVANGGTLSLAGGTLSGGTVQGLGAGSRMGGSGTFQNVSLQGAWLVAPGNPLNVAGTVTNTGTLTLGGGGNVGTAAVYLAGNTMLAGSGNTVLTDANYSYVGGTGTLTIAQGHTLRGAGYVATSVTNQGRVLVGSSEVLHVIGGALRNQGQFQINANGMLDAGGAPSGYVQDSASAITTVNGLLKASTLQLDAGMLKGSGTVQADVINLGGIIAAGNSPGTLTIDGHLALGESSLLVIEVAGLLQGVEYDWLKVNGDVTLGGRLQFDFGSYKPVIGETYSFLTSGSGHIGGTFTNAFANGYELTLGYSADGITARVDAITAVPEPATYGLMMLGLGLLGAHARRRRACGHDGPALLAISPTCADSAPTPVPAATFQS